MNVDSKNFLKITNAQRFRHLLKSDNKMKASFRTKYGSPEVLSVEEFEIPTPKDNELLIRVYATTVNRSDCHILTW